MLREFLTTGLEELEADCGGETFTWKTAEVPCVASMLERGIAIVVGQRETTIDCALIVRKENFLSADSTLVTVDSTLFTSDNGMRHPVAGYKLTFRGRSMRVATVSEDATRLFYKLTIIDANR